MTSASDREARTPTQRMLQMLWLLDKAPNKTLQGSAIWDAIKEYDEGRPSGRRLYRMDIRSLTARGLVSSGEQTASIGNRRAVTLRFIGKPKDYRLTPAEHAALRSARTFLQDLPPVPVTSGPAERGGKDLDLLTAAVRILEEHGDELTLAELAAELRLDSGLVLASLQQGWLLDAGPDESSVLGDLDIQHDDQDDESLWSPDTPDVDLRTIDPKVIRVSVLRPMSSTSLVNTGLAALGQFAYTAVETAERLALIERALAERPDDIDAEALEGAERKLRGWAHHLARTDA